MKKKEKSYPVNNQEDEDGYILQADARKKHRLRPPDNFENTRPSSAKLPTHSLILSSVQQGLER